MNGRESVDQTLGTNGGWRSGPWRIAAWSAAAGLFLLPVMVEFASADFGWDFADFIFWAVVLSVSCPLFDWAARKSPNFSYLAGSGAALAAGFGLIVVNGAVGLVGSEDEGHNLLFGLVLLVAIVGAFIARGRAEGLARAMLAAAVVHIAISAILLVRAGGATEATLGAEIIGLLVFAGVWLVSAWCFRQAAR